MIFTVKRLGQLVNQEYERLHIEAEQFYKGLFESDESRKRFEESVVEHYTSLRESFEKHDYAKVIESGATIVSVLAAEGIVEEALEGEAKKVLSKIYEGVGRVAFPIIRYKTDDEFWRLYRETVDEHPVLATAGIAEDALDWIPGFQEMTPHFSLNHIWGVKYVPYLRNKSIELIDIGYMAFVATATKNEYDYIRSLKGWGTVIGLTLAEIAGDKYVPNGTIMTADCFARLTEKKLKRGKEEKKKKKSDKKDSDDKENPYESRGLTSGGIPSSWAKKKK